MFIIPAFILFITVGAEAQEPSKELEVMVQWMSGDFTTEKEVSIDSVTAEFHWHLAEIWPGKPNGAWIYAELSPKDKPEEPLAQWVYFVTSLGEGELSSDTYDIPDKKEFVGAWREPSRFDALTPFDLKYREGCTIFLGYDGFQYDGRTNEKTCPTARGSADYSMTLLNITPRAIKFGESGFDDSGKKIWGPKGGTIQFIRDND